MQPKACIPPPEGDSDPVEQLLDAGGGVLGVDSLGNGLPRDRIVEMVSSANPPRVSATTGMKSTPAER